MQPTDRINSMQTHTAKWEWETPVQKKILLYPDDSQQPEGKYTNTFIRDICFARAIVVLKKEIPFIRRWKGRCSILPGHSKPFDSINGYNIKSIHLPTFMVKRQCNNMYVVFTAAQNESFVYKMDLCDDLLLCLCFWVSFTITVYIGVV